MRIFQWNFLRWPSFHKTIFLNSPKLSRDLTCLPRGFVGFAVGIVGMTTERKNKTHWFINQTMESKIEKAQFLTNFRTIATQTFTETLLLFAANLLAIHRVVIHLYTGDPSAEFASITRFASYYNGVVRGKTTSEATQSALDDGKTVEPEACQACSPIVSCSNVVPSPRLYSFVQRFHRFSWAWYESNEQSKAINDPKVKTPAFWIKMK